MNMQNSVGSKILDISVRFQLKNSKWASICIGIIAIIVFKLAFDNVQVKFTGIADLRKCPFCYGEKLCEVLQNDSIHINASILNKLIFLLNSKKPIRCTMNNQDVLIKKLASSSEFRDLDKLICEKFYHQFNSTECNEKPLNYLTALNYIYASNNVTKKLVFCEGDSFPTVLNIFRSNNDSKCPIDEIFKIWTLLKLNPEPLILQVLKAEEGWPVPKYFGSCGRLSVVEHCGKDLSEFVYDPLPVRMNLSLQVLDLAFNFTFSHENYAFYFTDITPMNLVVDQNNTVRLIDLEHVIISDKRSNKGKSDKSSTWDSPHFSEHIECKDCLAFSPEEICEHHISDHNFYAVCKEIFGNSTLMPGGLLHSPSECLKSTPPGLSSLLNDCIQPSGNLTRFQVVKELRELIEKCLLQEN